jgi:regulator of telomere elongation helicase 1
MKAVGKDEARTGSDGLRGKAAGSGKVQFRRKVDPLSPPTTLELRGIRIHFPFKPYKCQEAYMEKVLDALFRSENALLESPTGTGKTLMLLCATLAWQRQQQRSLREAAELPLSPDQPGAPSLGPQDGPAQAARSPQIIYASRTHSQLSQVVRELRNTRYRPPHAVLASREQMCVNPKVKKKHSTASDINHDCNKLGKERKCRYRNGLEGFVPHSNEHGGNNACHQPVMDMEELIDMGKSAHVCPFYYTRSQVENAELILVPYNYLFDKDARETTLADVRWKNAIVIFDEAHNLESFASDSASFDLSNADIAGCMNEVQRASNYLRSMPDLNYNLKEDNLVLLIRSFEGLENFILELGPQTAYGGEFMMEVLSKGAGITHANHGLFIEELRKVNDMIMDLRGTGATRGSPRLEHFVTCLKRVFGHRLEARCLAKASSYRVVSNT